LGLIWSDLQGNLRLGEQSLALYRELGNRWGVGNLLASVGWVLRGMGEYDRATQALEESLVIRRALGDKRGIGHSLQILRGVALRHGNAYEAEKLSDEVVAIHQDIGDRAGLANGYMGLGWARIQQGRFVEAHEQFEEAIEIYDDLGVRFDIVWAVTGSCSVNVHLGRYADASAQGQTGLALSQEAGIPTMIAYSYYLLGCAALAEERHAEAQNLSNESIANYRSTGDHNIAFPFALSGYAAVALAQPSMAREFLYRALEKGVTAGDVFVFLWTLPAAALLLAEQGDPERAVAVYALVSRHPFVASSRWFENVVGRHINVAAESLPREAIVAAQERGRARDLQDTAAGLLDELRELGWDD
jgi:tetratricopeptide (TPR) repeat protein